MSSAAAPVDPALQVLHDLDLFALILDALPVWPPRHRALAASAAKVHASLRRPLPRSFRAFLQPALPFSADRSQLMFTVKLAEQSERYEDMATYAKRLLLSDATTDDDDERRLFSVAYRNLSGSRRASLRVVASVEAKQKEQGSAHAHLATEYRRRLEFELTVICADAVTLVDSLLLSRAASHSLETRIDYLKMKMYLLSYVATDVARGEEKAEVTRRVQEAQLAVSESARCLKASHPLRLTDALTRARRLADMENDRAQASAIAKEAFDEAIAELDGHEEEIQQAAGFMHLLRANTLS